jgi:hypothetical protein
VDGEGLIVRQAGAVLLIGAALAAAVARGVHVPDLRAALEAQVPVYSWDAGELPDDVLVVDGRSAAAHAAGHPKGSLSIPFEEREEGVFDLPDARPVRAAVVVMEESRKLQARELAQWLGREWGLPRVGTLEGGIEAWRAP